MLRSKDIENHNTQNLPKAASSKDYDPILDSPIESSGSERSGSSESEEEDVEFPRDSCADLLAFLHRDI